MPMQLKFTEAERNQTIEQFLLQHNNISSFGNIQLNYLCGSSDWFCLNKNNNQTDEAKKLARDKAVYNLLNNYLIVGVLEQFTDFLEMLEFMLPDAFHPMVKNVPRLQTVYNMNRGLLKREFKTFEKPERTEGWVFEVLKPQWDLSRYLVSKNVENSNLLESHLLVFFMLVFILSHIISVNHYHTEFT